MRKVVRGRGSCRLFQTGCSWIFINITAAGVEERGARVPGFSFSDFLYADTPVSSVQEALLQVRWYQNSVIQCNMAASREPEDVIISRNGSVLGKKTILKSDHFPGCQNKRLLPHVEGAPNYRQVDFAAYSAVQFQRELSSMLQPT